MPRQAPAAVHILNGGKGARFDNRGDPAHNRAVIAVGRDRGLQALLDLRCPMTSIVEFEAYLQSTYRTATLARVELDWSKWSASPRGFRYGDPAATVRSIRYSQRGLRIAVGGAGFVPISGPVGYVLGQLTIGSDTLRALSQFQTQRRRTSSSRGQSTGSVPVSAFGSFWGNPNDRVSAAG